MVAVAVIGAGALGAASTAYSANKAAKAQTAAADKAADTSMAMYDKTRADLAPFRDIGGTATAEMGRRLADLTSPIVMDQATLEATPGYKWNLEQGLKSVQNSAAARGLGTSGAALKGAATFATGLADSTYQNQFNNAVTNQTNAFNKLKSLIDTGAGAAAQTGTAGSHAADTAASAAVGAGNAQAAAANATGSAITGALNNTGAYLAKGLYGSGQGGGLASYIK